MKNIRHGIVEPLDFVLSGKKSAVTRRHRTGVEILQTSSRLVFLSDPSRSFILFQNRSPLSVWINFNATASMIEGIEIGSGRSFERDSNSTPTGEIHMLGSFNAQPLNFEIG